MLNIEDLDHGDVVMLNSGGPEMTVDYVEDIVGYDETGETEPSVAVLRENEDGVIVFDAFHPQMLTFVRKYDADPSIDFGGEFADDFAE